MDEPHLGENRSVEAPVVETRKVVIQYTINVPGGYATHSGPSVREIAALAAEMVRKAAGKNRPL